MAANKGYFGVCPNCPADFKVAGNVTVAGGAGLATFAVPQTDVLMGVGARVTYNGGASIGYVASKVDQSNWYLVDANGVAMPNLGATAVVSITHPFASVTAAEAGYAALTGNADITAAGCNQDLCFPCYCEQSGYTMDLAPVTFDGPTCDETHEIFVYTPFNRATEVNWNHRNTNNGTWNATKFRMERSAGNVIIDIRNTAGNDEFIHIIGLQIRTTNTANAWLVRVRGTAGSRTWIDKCIMVMEDSNNIRHFVRVDTAQSNRLTIRNCIAYMATKTVYTENLEINFVFTGVNTPTIVIGCLTQGINIPVRLSGGIGVVYAVNCAWLDAQIAQTSELSDYNLYNNGINWGDQHGILSTQTTEELLSDTSGDPPDWVWYPREGSDLIGAGIKLRDEDSGDLDHPEGYRLVLETHPVDDYEDGDTWLPTDFLNPRGRWEVGALAYYPQNKIMYGICPNSGGDFKVAGQCAVLDGIMYFVNNQNHALMGIGARVVYDTTEIATVVGKLAEDQWMVLTLTGAKPADTNNVTVNSIQHPFGSQSTFEAGFAGNLGTPDLTQAEVSMHGVCYCEQVGFTVDNTAVTYDGTTCDDNYQLYVYTPWDTVRQCNFQHRVLNGGIWDATRYRLELAAQVLITGATVLQHLHVEGIQLHMTSVAAAHITSIYLFNNAAGKTWIHRCVIRVADVNANWLRTAVRLDQGLAEMTQCVVYLIGLNPVQVDFTGILADAGSTLDIYFCTIYGWRTPITESGGAIVRAQCNAIIGNSVVCSGLTTQDYNVYDVNEGETHGYLTVQADAALFTAVAGGRETWDWTPITGSDLIFRARHFNNYTPDLDHIAGWRYQGIAPDAGALEREQAICPFGVCPNCPASIETGAGTVTLLDGVATFEIPQINVLMGVGADVDYGAGPAHGYVREMINPFQFVLRTGAGAAPGNAANQAVNAIDHPFASQSAAEAGYAALTGNASLVAGDYQLWLPCYCEQTTYNADAVAAVYDGPTCDFDHWIKVFEAFSTVRESIVQHRVINNGAWDSTRYRHEMAGNPSIDINLVGGNISYIWFEGIQIHNSTNAAGNRTAIAGRGQNGSRLMIMGCVIRFSDGSNPRIAIGLITNAGTTCQAKNNVLLQPVINHINSRGVLIQVKSFMEAVHNLMIYCSRGIEALAGAIMDGWNNEFLETDSGNSGMDTSDYNLYRENDEGDANGILTTQTNLQLFNGFNGANHELSDWRPAPGSDLIDNGTVGTGLGVEFAYMLRGDLDHPFETEWRPQSFAGSTLYDIGPLERKYAGLVQWYNYW